MKDSAVVQTLGTLYYNSTDAESTHVTLREVAPEAGICYVRLNPAHRIYAYPLDTTDEATLDAMQAFAAHYVEHDAEASGAMAQLEALLKQEAAAASMQLDND